MRYVVLGGFCPWVRGGCTACSTGRGGSQCGEDVYPSSHAQRTIKILHLPLFLASLVFWLFLASMVFGINLRTFGLTTTAAATAAEDWPDSLLLPHLHTRAHRGSGNNGKRSPTFQSLWPQL